MTLACLCLELLEMLLLGSDHLKEPVLDHQLVYVSTWLEIGTPIPDNSDLPRPQQCTWLF